MELLPSRDVVKALGISNSTLSRYVANGRITPTLKGAGIRGQMWFWARDVEALKRELADERSTRQEASA